MEIDQQMPTVQQIAKQAQQSGMIVYDEQEFLTAMVSTEASASFRGVRLIQQDFLDVAMRIAKAGSESFTIPKC